MSDQKAFDRNFEEQLQATLPLVEAPGRRVLLVAVYSDGGPEDGDVVASGGLARAVSDGTTRRDAMAFHAGLEREVERLKRIIARPLA